MLQRPPGCLAAHLTQRPGRGYPDLVVVVQQKMHELGDDFLVAQLARGHRSLVSDLRIAAPSLLKHRRQPIYVGALPHCVDGALY